MVKEVKQAQANGDAWQRARLSIAEGERARVSGIYIPVNMQPIIPQLVKIHWKEECRRLTEEARRK